MMITSENNDSAKGEEALDEVLDGKTIYNANIREWIENPMNLTLASAEKIQNSFKKISWKMLISLKRSDLVFHSIYIRPMFWQFL